MKNVASVHRNSYEYAPSLRSPALSLDRADAERPPAPPKLYYFLSNENFERAHEVAFDEDLHEFVCRVTVPEDVCMLVFLVCLFS